MARRGSRELRQLSIEIRRSPEQHLIQILSPDCSDQPLDKRVRDFSNELRCGARWRVRFMISSWCLRRRVSVTIALAPPGRSNRMLAMIRNSPATANVAINVPKRTTFAGTLPQVAKRRPQLVIPFRCTLSSFASLTRRLPVRRHDGLALYAMWHSCFESEARVGEAIEPSPDQPIRRHHDGSHHDGGSQELSEIAGVGRSADGRPQASG